jgi:hypothetical protein
MNTKQFFFYLINIYGKKNNIWPRVLYTRGKIWTRVLLHVSILMRV